MTCKHEKTYILYGRSENSWINAKSLCGVNIYICADNNCGAILEKKLSKRKTLTIKKEVN